MAQTKCFNYLITLCFSGCVILFLVFSGCSKHEDTPNPSESTSITSISPESGSDGAQVTITGKGFSETLSDNVVKFNGNVAILISGSTTQLMATVPANAGTGLVTLTVGGKTITGPTFTYLEPQPTMTYYLKYKVNGSTKIYESGLEVYQSCGNCACTNLPPLSDDHAEFSICQPNNDWIVSSDITGWNGTTIVFTDSEFPHAAFGYIENNVTYYSDNVADQTGSSVSITNVVTDGVTGGKDSYKVTGTFHCKVATSGGSAIAITEGQFVVRFSED